VREDEGVAAALDFETRVAHVQRPSAKRGVVQPDAVEVQIGGFRCALKVRGGGLEGVAGGRVGYLEVVVQVPPGVKGNKQDIYFTCHSPARASISAQAGPSIHRLSVVMCGSRVAPASTVGSLWSGVHKQDLKLALAGESPRRGHVAGV